MRPRILALIPARGGSKGVPRKNIRLLGGAPLIAHVHQAASKSKYIDKLILSTDDEEIAKVGQSLGMDVPFVRPGELAREFSLLPGVSKHAMMFFDDLGDRYEGILSLQPTCPFLSTESIDKAVETWLEHGCDSVTSVSEITKGHPYIAKRVKEDLSLENFSPIPEGAITSPRQKREKAFFLTGGLYMRHRRLLDAPELTGHCLGADSRAVVVSELEAVDINTEIDFKFAELLMSLQAEEA
ncbi:cytidylyltransferase domain-containing protein [Desulfatibacillum aliphaticivorans]|uniref:acylneuraminate cytidylyltransferase family protein n=1 Tax=Desulfatibacillum aliphaticivorans TaxID=218208 RepID=UPI000408CFC6|nr:acylneuraminate cytidylyltransferase family protein [Desulfatibacillum aliphaticivorans]